MRSDMSPFLILLPLEDRMSAGVGRVDAERGTLVRLGSREGRLVMAWPSSNKGSEELEFKERITWMISQRSGGNLDLLRMKNAPGG